jgi:hypothetical protein
VKRTYVVAVVILTGTLAVVVARSTKAGDANQPSPLDPLARFVGGAWLAEPNPKTDTLFPAKVVYDWGKDRGFLKAKFFRLSADGETLLYESQFVWHPRKRQVIFQTISAGSILYDGIVECRGDTFDWRWSANESGAHTVYRQTIQLVDANKALATLYTKKSDDWVKIAEVKQHRMLPAAKPAG